MKVEQKGWEPILESQPSDRFICSYGGPLARQLELNRAVVEKFLGMAALGSPVVLTESKFRRHRAYPDINPDGSVAGKGLLRFGERLHFLNREPREKFQVDLNGGGNTKIAINGDLILEELTKDSDKSVREVGNQFSHKFDYLLRVSLKEALLKDKLTFAGDQYFIGRINMSFAYLMNILLLVNHPTYLRNVGNVMFDVAVFALFNYVLRQALEIGLSTEEPLLRIFNGRRRSVNKVYEGLFYPPFEIDRLALAYGYLDYQKLKGNPLIRMSD